MNSSLNTLKTELFTSAYAPPTVASSGFGTRKGTKLRENNFKGGTQKYYEIHAINSDKAIGQYIYTLWAIKMVPRLFLRRLWQMWTDFNICPLLDS